MLTDLPASASAPSHVPSRTGTSQTDIQIRLATSRDEAAIGGLIERCPERGAVTFGFRVVGRLEALLGRFPTARIHLACGPGGVVVGMIVSELALVQISGQEARGARVSFLRTDPAFRGRGIGVALLLQAERDARAADGAEVFWGHVMDGNRASHATCARAGYRRGPGGRFKLVDPQRCPRPALDSPIRVASEEDMRWLTSMLNARYAGHDFWRVFSAADYREALEKWTQAGGTPRVWILAGADGRPLAGTLAYGNGHALVHRVEKISPWLRLVGRIMRLPIVPGKPLRITTVADVVADPKAPKGAAASIARHAIREQRGRADFVMLVRHANERGDEAYGSVHGASSAVDVIYKDCLPRDRPSYIEPW